MVRRSEILTSFHFASFRSFRLCPFSPTTTPLPTTALSFCAIAPSLPSPSQPVQSQPLSARYFISTVYSCVLDHLCVSECCLRRYCSYVCTGEMHGRPNPPFYIPPPPPGREGYLDSGKNPGLPRCFVLVLILHFPRCCAFLFSLLSFFFCFFIIRDNGSVPR